MGATGMDEPAATREAAEKSAKPGRPGRPRDAEVDGAVAAYARRCAELLPEGALDPAYAAASRHAAFEAAIAAASHAGLRSAVISRCRREGLPLPPRGRRSREVAVIEAVLVAVWHLEAGPEGAPRVVMLGHRHRTLLPEHPSPAQLLVWRERAAVRRINALPPEERRAAVLRLAARAPRPA